MKQLSSGRKVTSRNYGLYTLLALLFIAGLMLVFAGLALIACNTTHYEDGSGVIDGGLVTVAYCNPVMICAED